ncbi:NAD(P)-dependent alcohol dehydrogenase [Acinetobacter oleivorans]|uniref:NAD(P)-dependent alcohol dehydrogenase n=1 Tax=Acinetobacter oleivorans TaxID=1148157 RepID=UPI00157FFF67|nr:NAD(P)-dependent alcohol dehydrogenase [Acinetobacter oleivorans]NUF32155.1 NAD(P)-dependent alcohol dehydrogenase [Acinetobacter oleivorans]
MKIRAAVVKSVNEPYEIETLELAEPLDDEVQVKIVASGICHSDDAVRLGHAAYEFPGVLGHEGAGIVEKVGKNIKNFKVGDHVVLAYAYCKQCNHCMHGLPAACTDWMTLNWGKHRDDGSAPFKKEDGTEVNNFFFQSSFATHTNVKETNLIAVPKEADLRLLGPLGCGLLTGSGTVLNGLKPTTGSSIAIFGTGAVGLAAMMTAKIMGCSTIIAVDIHDSRLSLAEELGATHVINSKSVDAVEKIKEITKGVGVNYSIDTTGISEVMKASIDALAIKGVAAPVAVTNKDLTVNTLADLVVYSRKIIGVVMGEGIPQISIPQLLEFHAQGKFPYEKLIKFYDFEDINTASSDSLSGKTIKPVLIVDRSYAA